jgi:hypothetical protein
MSWRLPCRLAASANGATRCIPSTLNAASRRVLGVGVAKITKIICAGILPMRTRLRPLPPSSVARDALDRTTRTRCQGGRFPRGDHRRLSEEAGWQYGRPVRGAVRRSATRHVIGTAALPASSVGTSWKMRMIRLCRFRSAFNFRLWLNVPLCPSRLGREELHPSSFVFAAGDDSVVTIVLVHH